MPPPELPRWPFTAMFVLFPLWWMLGPGEAMWIVLAGVMVFYLVRRGGVRVPRGFGLWLLFLIWMLCSVIGIDSSGRLIGFVYRALLYLTVTVIFVYVYNARSTLTPRYLAGVLSVFWVVVVVGGFVGVLFPLLSFTTPLSAVIPHSIASNELVQEMVRRRVTQYNPDAFLPLEPRPSAPFLYTNGWGNAYSVLTPIFVAYLVQVRRERRFWWLAVLLPISFVPAFLTLNRGMFIGIGLALAYVAVRAIVRGHLRVLIAITAVGALAAMIFAVFPVADRLTDRLASSPSTEDRASLYQETFERTLESPVFGYGAPRPSQSPGSPAAGTQGQVWMVLFSHGFAGLFFFLAWLTWVFVRSIRVRDPVLVAANTVLLVVIVQSTYYSILTTGLAVAMIAAAATLRPSDPRDPSPIDVSREEIAV
ncbi:MAG: O-antigen ligase family protein [Microbacteriaceae bacterium]